MAKPLVFVGIDVAQATLEVAVRPTGEAWQVDNDEIAFSDLVERVQQLKPSLRQGHGQVGTVSHKQIAALVGLVPLNQDSGKKRGQRVIWGGRASVRAALYMATLVATRRNPVIQGFYQRLLAMHKPKKLALTACMHKLLTTLNAMARRRSPWSVLTPASA